MLAALNAPVGKPATTYRTRVDALSSKELPAIVLYSLDEMVEVRGPHTRLRKRKVRLEAMIEGEPPADQALDPIYAFAVQTLIADAATAALVKGLYEAHMQWETEASYLDACVAVLDFEVHFTTTEDPAVAGAQ